MSTNLDPLYPIVPMRDKIVIENEGFASKIGGLGGTSISDINNGTITAPGNDKDIIFNDGGKMGGDDNLQWDKNIYTLFLGKSSVIQCKDGIGVDHVRVGFL